MNLNDRDDALGDFDAVGLAQEIQARRVSPLELQQAAMDRALIAHRELNAIAEFIPIDTRSRGVLPGGSRTGHGSTSSGRPGNTQTSNTQTSNVIQSTFADLPTFAKDNNDVVGVPTRHGSIATPETPATQSSPFIADMSELGIKFLGKTTMPEFGLISTTETHGFGATRNPRNLAHSVGGSSGGSAALVAAGVVPFAHGNDGGGSIRIPASCCGLVGMKVSRGRFRGRPEMEGLPVRIGTEGILSRTVRDTATFYHELSRVYKSPTLAPIPLVDRPGRRLKIAFHTDAMDGIAVDPQVAQTVRDAAAICEQLGHRVEEISMPFGPEVGRDFLRYWSLLAFVIRNAGKRQFGPEFDKAKLEPFTNYLASLFPGKALSLRSTVRRLQRFAATYEQAFANYDVLVSPVTCYPSPELGYMGPDVDPHEVLIRLLRYVTSTPIQNISGAPAISLPLGVTAANVPIGVQFASEIGREADLLALAFELEEAAGWK